MMFSNHEYEQFRLRQNELEKQAEHERKLNELRKQKSDRRDRREPKQNSLLSRISVLF